MYDPCIGSFDAQNDIYTLPFLEANNNVLNFNQSYLEYIADLDESCGFAEYREYYMHFPPNGTQPVLPEPHGKCNIWDTSYYAAYAPNPCFNVYDVAFQCPLLTDPLGYPSDLQYLYRGLKEIYFNRTDVKEAMHAPMDVSWLECAAEPVLVAKGSGGPGTGGPEGYGDTSPDPM